VLVWANVGGLLGALVFSFLSVRFELKILVLGSLAACGVFLAIFGQVPRDLASLSMAAAATVFFGSAGVVGFYALMATSFPTHARASGIGFVIGVGRGGSALGPMIGGAMFAAGLSLEMTMVAMAAGSLLGTIMLALLLSRRDPTA
jgi:MFS family permease